MRPPLLAIILSALVFEFFPQLVVADDDHFDADDLSGVRLRQHRPRTLRGSSVAEEHGPPDEGDAPAQQSPWTANPAQDPPHQQPPDETDSTQEQEPPQQTNPGDAVTPGNVPITSGSAMARLNGLGTELNTAIGAVERRVQTAKDDLAKAQITAVTAENQLLQEMLVSDVESVFGIFVRVRDATRKFIEEWTLGMPLADGADGKAIALRGLELTLPAGGNDPSKADSLIGELVRRSKGSAYEDAVAKVGEALAKFLTSSCNLKDVDAKKDVTNVELSVPAGSAAMHADGSVKTVYIVAKLHHPDTDTGTMRRVWPGNRNVELPAETADALKNGLAEGTELRAESVKAVAVDGAGKPKPKTGSGVMHGHELRSEEKGTESKPREDEHKAPAEGLESKEPGEETKPPAEGLESKEPGEEHKPPAEGLESKEPGEEHKDSAEGTGAGGGGQPVTAPGATPGAQAAGGFRALFRADSRSTAGTATAAATGEAAGGAPEGEGETDTEEPHTSHADSGDDDGGEEE